MTHDEFLRASELRGMDRASTFIVGWFFGMASFAGVAILYLLVVA